MRTVKFLQASRDSPFTATHSLPHKLITLTIETGMITSIAAISELVLFQIFPNNNMHFIPCVSCKLSLVEKLTLVQLPYASETVSTMSSGFFLY